MNVKLDATKRMTGRKSINKQARKDGLIPAIIYSSGKEGINISINRAAFIQKYRKTIGELAFYDITVDGETYKTIIKDRQIHPVSREFMHIDFMELHAGQEITLEVPINYIGDAPGVSAGGTLDIIERKMEISCLPKDIPEEITIDLSNLNLGATLHFSDIEMPANVNSLFTEETALATVHAPTSGNESTEEESEEDIIAE
jgi:large subunit ribosomal protein L25